MNIETIKKKYPTGTRLLCNEMHDYHAVPSGTKGTVLFVDDIGTIHVKWDNGSTLGLICEEDSFTIIGKNIPYSLKDVNISLNLPYVQKEVLQPVATHIETAIELSKEDLLYIMNNPMIDNEIITNYIDEMYIDYGINHSILLYSNDYPDGIAVESEGYNYLRYQAYVPNARELVLEKQVHKYEDSVKEKSIKVLVVEPHMPPYEAIIPNELESLQSMVRGYIEVVPLSNSACIICNENGKLEGLEPNRRLYGDVLVGRFIIVGDDGGEHFVSISREDIQKYTHQFQDVEMISSNEINEKFEFYPY